MQKADAIVVLGGGINGDSTLPLFTQQRAETGANLYKQGLASYLVLSGKHPHGWDDKKPHKTEAQVMQEYIVGLGINVEQIILEADSTSTVGNALHTKLDVLVPRNWNDVIVVTSDFHVARTEYIFRKVLGQGYIMKFVEAPSGLTGQDLHARLDSEQRAMRALKRSGFNDIKDGDDEAVKRYLEHRRKSRNGD